MNVGVQMVFQSYGYGPDVTDGQVVAEEVHLAELADELGFDALWPVEHHFEDYSFCPDNTVLLAHLAARTRRIRLGTGAVILPWNDPLRVAEKISLLDHLADGRVLFGVGRGLARREYAGFGIPMDESRDRFDEAARMVVDALETGWIEGDGPYYRQARTPIRPEPARSFRDRLYCVAMSPDSVLAAADLGARMVTFSQRPWEDQAKDMATYRERFTATHGRSPGPPVTCDFVYCDTDPARAEDKAREHLAGYLTSVVQHYELVSDHFKDARGYEAYGNAVDLLKAIGLERMCEMYLGVQAWGTPAQVLERLHARREVIGDFELTACFRYAGLPLEDAERSMRTFAHEVLPALHATT
ncbi:MAG TPA: LLM class flavin-dependent oxidoreductase [Acidimicrobiales bacterium]|nr:LLM class flavin-dependent oxidoreductase [Acidimicrobiales bacterium]